MPIRQRPSKLYQESLESEFAQYSVWYNLPEDIKKSLSGYGPRFHGPIYDYYDEKWIPFKPKLSAWKRLLFMMKLHFESWRLRRKIYAFRSKHCANQMDADCL